MRIINECLKKKKYTTKEFAEKVAATRNLPLRVYGCFFCGAYHLTKKTGYKKNG